MDGERGRRNGLAHPFPISPISFLCWHSPSLNYLSSIDGGNGANRSHSLSLVSCSRLRRWKRQTRREDGKGTGRWMLVTKRKEELLCHHSIPHCSTSGQAFPYPFLLLHSFPLPFVSSVITHALHGKERNDWEGMTVFPLPHSSLPESIVKTKGKGWMEVMCEEAIGRLVSSFHSSFSLLASFPFGPSLITIHLYLSLSCLHQTDKVMKEIQEMNWRHANPSFLPLCLSSHASSTLGFTNIMVTEEAMKGKGKENEKGKEKTCRLEKPVNEQDISKKKGFSNYNSFLPFASLGDNGKGNTRSNR